MANICPDIKANSIGPGTDDTMGPQYLKILALLQPVGVDDRSDPVESTDCDFRVVFHISAVST